MLQATRACGQPCSALVEGARNIMSRLGWWTSEGLMHPACHGDTCWRQTAPYAAEGRWGEQDNVVHSFRLVSLKNFQQASNGLGRLENRGLNPICWPSITAHPYNTPTNNEAESVPSESGVIVQKILTESSSWPGACLHPNWPRLAASPAVCSLPGRLLHHSQQAKTPFLRLVRCNDTCPSASRFPRENHAALIFRADRRGRGKGKGRTMQNLEGDMWVKP